jgi:hypothetical protein
MDMKRAVPAFLAILLAGAALSAAAQATPARTIKVKVTAEQANLREKPDIGSGILQQIPEGTVLDADRKEGEWFFVRYALEDGGVIGGWIHESLVQAVEEAAPPPPVKAPGRETARPVRPAPARARAERPRPLPLELSVSAGLGPLSSDDLNNGTRGFADWFGASIGIPAPGDPETLSLGWLAGVEIAYRVSPRLAIGLGADFIRATPAGETTYTDLLLTETLATKPSVRGVPVKLSVRFYPGAGLYLRGALGVYAVKAGYLYRREGIDSWEQWKGSASASGFGGEAAFGGEWGVATSAALFAEGGFRMASFGGLTGEGVYTDSTGERLTEPGRLYYVRRTGADDGVYPMVLVAASAPAGPDIVASRRARVSLSGTSVRAGLRFRF